MTTANATEEQTVILGLGAKKRLAFMFETVQQYKQVWKRLAALINAEYAGKIVSLKEGVLDEATKNPSRFFNDYLRKLDIKSATKKIIADRSIEKKLKKR